MAKNFVLYLTHTCPAVRLSKTASLSALSPMCWSTTLKLDMVFSLRICWRLQPKASLVQREVAARRADGGIVMYRQPTIPQTKIKDFCQPPLHKGAFERRMIMDFYKVPISFGLALSSNTAAMNRYAHLTEEQK